MWNMLNKDGVGPSILDEVPNIAARTLNQGSAATSMDFHPVHQTLLLVGTNMGGLSLWEVGSMTIMFAKPFGVLNRENCSMQLKAAFRMEPCISVRCIVWSPDGSLFGVAYSKHLVQMFSYSGGGDIRPHLEIEAHTGSVNDMSFCTTPNKKLMFITCGDDMSIKLFDVATGGNHIILQGHEAPVISVCPQAKAGVNYCISVSADGKIKTWLYASKSSLIDYDTPGHACSRMTFSADGQRLFSCGTNKEGESHMAEWNEYEGTIKRTYQGFANHCSSIVHFDTSKNRFLAAGDNFSVKFWDMDHSNLLNVVDAEGGLPAKPYIRFNKGGNLLAVSTNDNKIKILATNDGIGMMHLFERVAGIVHRATAQNPTRNGHVRMHDRNPTEGRVSPFNMQTSIEIKEPAQCQSLRIPASGGTDKIMRLMYNNAASGILTLRSNGVHQYWRWPATANGKVTTKIMPGLQQSASGRIMTNDTMDNSIADEGLSCLALTNNDFYIMSASGGKVSMFNLVTFKIMASFVSPPPAATCIAMLPRDSNIVAVGLVDLSIQIYNVGLGNVIRKLEGHETRVTCLAFSPVENIIVSAEANGMLIKWRVGTWVRVNSRDLKIPGVSVPMPIHVQFYQDKKFIVVGATFLSIRETISRLKCIQQWVVPESWGSITDAKLSCKSKLVYCSFSDGSLKIFNAATLKLMRQINPSAYLPTYVIASPPIYPQAVAVHPHDDNQLAVGLSDGSIHVFEPLEREGRWDLSMTTTS